MKGLIMTGLILMVTITGMVVVNEAVSTAAKLKDSAPGGARMERIEDMYK